MLIGGLQKTTLLDYPGHVACTVFTVGCNLKCPFCHNKDLAIGNAEGVDKTTILNFLSKRVGILDGVCITGGEPLLWTDLEFFIKDIKNLGFKIKLDTNGTFPDRLEKLIKSGNLDYIAMDIKNSFEKYEETVGVPYNIKDIQKSIKLIQKSGIDHEFRTTVMRPLHEEKDLLAIARLLGKNDKYFIQNFVNSGHLIKDDGLSAFSNDELKSMVKSVQRILPEAKLRGVE